ncbi:hypothetical protein L211DRAFT_843007 [Terfezia boudieri ATCC MYA-4762]|uniref:Rab proteins geranylgeranyltransferase n=1 Tax=Terfezia boudieri ATCC MYA-4762 TaxID=1051890 RepID=A0A3N4LME3_9PEZI|nr:hypothetical protein L211DRAFT_843007 [Terfezia boudieri ATCC MYA-4762]
MSPPPPVEPLPNEPWDVLIFGTGLKQSLLACALSRANKKVLQLDHNSYYGSSETCFAHLLECDEWVSQVNSSSSRPLPFSHARIWRDESHFPTSDGYKACRGYTLTLAPNVVYWHDRLLEVLRNAEMTGGFVWQAVGAWWVYEEEKREGDGSSEAAVLGKVMAGAGVKIAKAGMKVKAGWNKGRGKKMVEEGGSAAPGTQVGVDSTAAISPTTETAPAASTAASTTTLRTVPPTAAKTNTPSILKETPCTFEDIAWDPSLTDTHRTTLASFLRYLQSHSTTTPPPPSTTLYGFLATAFPLPPRLISHIHALTLLPTSPSETLLSLALPRLSTHFSSLGKIPDARSASALLISYGGAAEMCQVFSRGAAVAGAVNALARGVTSLSPSPTEEGKWEATLSTDEKVTASWVVGGRWDLPSSAPSVDNVRSGMKRMARGIYIIDHPLEVLLKPKYADERITPGGCVLTVFEEKKGMPVYIFARASSPGECPTGKSLLYAGILLSQETELEERSEEIEKAYLVLDNSVKKVLDRVAAAQLPSSPSPTEQQSEIHPSNLIPGIIYKLLYTQYAHPPTSPSTTMSSTSPTFSDSSNNLITISDLPLDLSLQGEILIEEVLRVYENILGLGRGEGVEGFLMVGEEARRLMREMEGEGE